jgi:hypothetical protein
VKWGHVGFYACFVQIMNEQRPKLASGAIVLAQGRTEFAMLFAGGPTGRPCAMYRGT